MIPRYSREVMARIWTEEAKFNAWLLTAGGPLPAPGNLFSGHASHGPQA